MTSTPFKAITVASHPKDPMPTVKLHASTIIGAFEEARSEIIGKAVVLTDGKAGTVENIWLDDLHGLRVSIRGHDGKWPISTVKLVQSDRNRL
jgi:PRC-barrel domain